MKTDTLTATIAEELVNDFIWDTVGSQVADFNDYTRTLISEHGSLF